jgi:hypothetical protein
MSSKKVYYIMIGLIVLLIGLGTGSIVIGNKLLKKQSDKLVELKLEDHLLDQQQVALIQANRDIEQYAELEKVAKSIVPQEKDQARAVREITQFARESGVTLKSISFPSSNLGQNIPQAAPPAGDDAAQSAGPAVPPVSQVKPVDGIPGVYSLEITIQSADENGATYAGFLEFLNRLENNRRTAHVTNISITPSTTRPNALSFSLIVNVYIKP